MQSQKTQKSQHNIEEQSWTTDTINVKIYYKVAEIKDSVVLVKAQTDRLVEQNREPRYRPIQHS